MNVTRELSEVTSVMTEEAANEIRSTNMFAVLVTVLVVGTAAFNGARRKCAKPVLAIEKPPELDEAEREEEEEEEEEEKEKPSWMQDNLTFKLKELGPEFDAVLSDFGGDITKLLKTISGSMPAGPYQLLNRPMLEQLLTLFGKSLWFIIRVLGSTYSAVISIIQDLLIVIASLAAFSPGVPVPNVGTFLFGGLFAIIPVIPSPQLTALWFADLFVSFGELTAVNIPVCSYTTVAASGAGIIFLLIVPLYIIIQSDLLLRFKVGVADFEWHVAGIEGATSGPAAMLYKCLYGCLGMKGYNFLKYATKMICVATEAVTFKAIQFLIVFQSGKLVQLFFFVRGSEGLAATCRGKSDLADGKSISEHAWTDGEADAIVGVGIAGIFSVCCLGCLLSFFMPLVFGTRDIRDWDTSRIAMMRIKDKKKQYWQEEFEELENGEKKLKSYKFSPSGNFKDEGEWVPLRFRFCWKDRTEWLKWWKPHICIFFGFSYGAGLFLDVFADLMCIRPCAIRRAKPKEERFKKLKRLKSALKHAVMTISGYANIGFNTFVPNMRRLSMSTASIYTDEVVEKYQLVERAQKNTRANDKTNQGKVATINAKVYGLYWFFFPGTALLTKMAEYANETASIFVFNRKVTELTNLDQMPELDYDKGFSSEEEGVKVRVKIKESEKVVAELTIKTITIAGVELKVTKVGEFSSNERERDEEKYQILAQRKSFKNIIEMDGEAKKEEKKKQKEKKAKGADKKNPKEKKKSLKDKVKEKGKEAAEAVKKRIQPDDGESKPPGEPDLTLSVPKLLGSKDMPTGKAVYIDAVYEGADPIRFSATIMGKKVNILNDRFWYVDKREPDNVVCGVDRGMAQARWLSFVGQIKFWSFFTIWWIISAPDYEGAGKSFDDIRNSAEGMIFTVLFYVLLFKAFFDEWARYLQKIAPTLRAMRFASKLGPYKMKILQKSVKALRAVRTNLQDKEGVKGAKIVSPEDMFDIMADCTTADDMIQSIQAIADQRFNTSLNFEKEEALTNALDTAKQKISDIVKDGLEKEQKAKDKAEEKKKKKEAKKGKPSA